MDNTDRRHPSKPNKRYKTFLDPNYEEHWVSSKIHKSWMEKATGIDTTTTTDQSITEPNEDTSEFSDDDALQHVPVSIHRESTSSTNTDQSDEYQTMLNNDNSSNGSIFNDGNLTDDEYEHHDYQQQADMQNEDYSIMFEASALSIIDVMQMITGFCMRFRLSHEARKALVDMIRYLAGPMYQNWTMSKYKLRQQYDPPENVISYTFFCTSCKASVLGPIAKKEFVNKAVSCEKCQQSQQLTMQSGNRFVYIDFEYQFRQLMSNGPIRKSLMDNLNMRNNALDESEPCRIRDIYDGELYRAAMKKISCEKDNLLSYNFNTDGMPIFNSSKKSSWPLLLTLNELPPHLRFKHVLLCGLWIGDKEPTPTMMNTFLEQFSIQANYLLETGITLQTDTKDGVTFKLMPLCCIVDSVARPIVQNRLQYNGYHGCSWCYARGKYVRGVVRYFFDEADVNLRSDESHRSDVEKVAEFDKPVNGVKGASILLQLPLFDIVWGFPFELMHGGLLGVVKLLWEISNSPGSSPAVHLNEAQRHEINARVVNMTPVHEIQRLPRPLSDKCKWKASEWLSWLLFYSLPCLNGIMQDIGLNHLSLLVGSIFVLLQNTISLEELNECEINLLRFVGEFEILYGEENVTFNVHSLLHIVKSVKMSGPLWASSAFTFESTNYHLKQQVNGPKGVDDQISIRYLHRNIFNWKLGENPQNCEVSTQYCKDLFTRSKCANYTRCNENAVLLGKGRLNNNADVVYDRCIFGGIVFHSFSYKPDKKSNDSIVLLNTNEIARITGFLNVDGQCHVDVQKMNTNKAFQVSHILKVSSYTDIVRRIQITEIKEKLLILIVQESAYVCLMPNIFNL